MDNRGRGRIVSATARGRRLNQRQDQSPNIIRQPVYNNPFTVETRIGSSSSRQFTINPPPDTPPLPVPQIRQLLQRKDLIRSLSRSMQRDGSFDLESLSTSEPRQNVNGVAGIAMTETEEVVSTEEETEEEWTLTPRITQQDTSRPPKIYRSTAIWSLGQSNTAENIDDREIGVEFEFSHGGDVTPGYIRPSTPMKRKQEVAFEQVQDEVRNDGSDEEEDHAKQRVSEGSQRGTQRRYEGESNSRESIVASVADIKARAGQLLQRRRGQQQQTGEPSLSSLSNVFQSTPSSSTLSSSESRTPGEFFLRRPNIPAPSAVRQFTFTRDFPTTPTGRGARGQIDDPPPLWSSAGLRAVRQLKHSIFDKEVEDEKDLAEAEAIGANEKAVEIEMAPTESRAESRQDHLLERATGQDVTAHSFTSAALAKQSAEMSSRLLSSERYLKQQRQARQESPKLDEVHVYREEDLGDTLNISSAFSKLDEAVDTDDLQKATKLDDSDFNISSADHSYSINNNEEDGDDEDTKLLERRVQERVQEWMAASGKTGSSWSSSTSAGRISRDGRGGGGAGFPYRKVGESSKAQQQQQQQQQQRQIQIEEKEEGVEEEEVDMMVESELEDKGEDESEAEAEPESEDAKIKRQLESEMDVELLGYQETSFDDVNESSAGMLSTSRVLEELGRDYCQKLTSPEELEHLTWMYEVGKIGRPQRIAI